MWQGAKEGWLQNGEWGCTKPGSKVVGSMLARQDTSTVPTLHPCNPVGISISITISML